MDIRLDDRTALVTGSTGGIGAAIARGLAGSGAFVVVSGRDGGRGAGVVAAIESAGGRAAFVPADLSGGESAVRALADAALAASGGRIDILVNNAARLVTPGATAEVAAALIEEAVAVNVVAPFLLTGLLAPRMAGRGGGAVVNVGSINGLVGMRESALYSMTKASLHSLTKSWAAEYAASGVRVNTVAPGPTATDRNLAQANHLGSLMERIPSRRMSTLDEIADAVVFLASDRAAHVHGATLSVDGGFAAV